MMSTRTKRESAIHWYSEEQKWFEEHGGSLSAYIERYGSVHDPDHYGDGGEAIYLADKAALDRAEEAALDAIRAARR